MTYQRLISVEPVTSIATSQRLAGLLRTRAFACTIRREARGLGAGDIGVASPALVRSKPPVLVKYSGQ